MVKLVQQKSLRNIFTLGLLIFLIVLSNATNIRKSSIEKTTNPHLVFLQANCYSKFIETMSDTGDNGLDDILTLSTQLCPASLSTIKNQYKPYLCTFSSIFSYIYLRKYGSKVSVKDYASDYCNSLDDIEQEKITLISHLSSLQLINQTQFLNKCVNFTLNHEQFNSWIDPLIPVKDITVGIICSNLYTLYSTMNQDASLKIYDHGYIPFEYFLVKTNTLILMEYINVAQFKAFQNCSDSELANLNFTAYCQNNIMNYIDFWVWNTPDKNKICQDLSIKGDQFKTCDQAVEAVFEEVIEHILQAIEDTFDKVATSQSTILMKDYQ